MEAYSMSYSASESSYVSQNSEEARGLKNGYPYSQSHDSSRKSQGKAWKKAPVAPPPATPVKIYQVDVMNFRDLVQQLTGAPEFKPQQLHPQPFHSRKQWPKYWNRARARVSLGLNFILFLPSLVIFVYMFGHSSIRLEQDWLSEDIFPITVFGNP